MPAERAPAEPGDDRPAMSREERLERGDIVCYERCPFPLPAGDDLVFLMQQRHSRWAHKNISYDPDSGRVTGFRRGAPGQATRLRRLLGTFSQAATAWLAAELPRYARAWQLDRASLRPEEEATRRLRLTARNDLLHVDAFPTRPSHGRRILRLFVNINPSEPRVWVTSESFAHLLARYGRTAGLPTQGRTPKEKGRSGRTSPFSFLLSPFSLGSHTPYDRFMLRFHDFLKANDDFQERGPRRFWAFAPGSAWLVFTDGVAHAVLRGRYALEHSYFVAPEALALPDASPAAHLARFCAGLACKEAA